MAGVEEQTEYADLQDPELIRVHQSAPAALIPDDNSLTAAPIGANGSEADDALARREAHPMSGLLFVEGADPGDAISVTIDLVSMTRWRGWTCQGSAHRVEDQDQAAHTPTREKIL